MQQKGIFVVLSYHLVRNQSQLRLSPMGCVPQRERRPCMINDYTFSGVNEATLKMVPPEAMQWGKTLHRLLQYIFTADARHGPVLLSKTDLSDGFYQLGLTPTGALKLTNPFPSLSGEPPLVAIPTGLPMGWTELPPAFSSVTETITDMVNEQLESSTRIPPLHKYETATSTHVPIEVTTNDYSIAETDPLITETGPLRPPLQ